MKLVSLKCQSCGSSLKVKPGENSAKCSYCGVTTYIDDEKIIVEHKFKQEEIDLKLENASVFLYKLKKYDKALELYDELSKLIPGNSKIWEGIILSETKNFKEKSIDEYGEAKVDFLLIKSAFENYCALVDEDDEFKQAYKEYETELNNILEIHKNKFDDEEEIEIEEESSKDKTIKSDWYVLAIIILIIVILATSIRIINSKTSEDSKEEKTKQELLEQEFYDDFSYVTKVKCSAFNENIHQFDLEGFFVDNKAYSLNIEKIYSNEENCKENDFEKEVFDTTNSHLSIGNVVLADSSHYSFYEGNYILTSNKYACHFSGSCYALENPSNGWASILDYKDKFSYIEVIANEFGFDIKDTESYQIQRLYKSGDEQIFYLFYNNKLYYLKLDKTSVAPGVKNIYFRVNEEIELNLDKDEFITNITQYIRTNKAYYKMVRYKSNKEECEKYADVKCVYKRKLVKEEVLSSKYDEIYYANRYVVMKDGSIYEGISLDFK